MINGILTSRRANIWQWLYWLIIAIVVGHFTDTADASVIDTSHSAEDGDRAAHWVSANQLLLPQNSPKVGWLMYSKAVPQQAIAIQAMAQKATVKEGYWHLSDWQSYKVSLTPSVIKQWLKHGIYVYHPETRQRHQVQTGWLLDELYTSKVNDADEYTSLGASVKNDGVQFSLWAPTARQVSVSVFNSDKTIKHTLPLVVDNNTGIWSVTTSTAQPFDYYLYQVTVFHPTIQQMVTTSTTDPYSLSLSTNSHYSQVIDLSAQATKPDGWQQQNRPTLATPESQIIYEMHVGDFSGTDHSISRELRGTYEAFSERSSDSMQHLKLLVEAGINTAHLLPVFDIGTVNEDKQQRIALHDPLSKVCQIITTLNLCEQSMQSQSVQQLLETMPVDSAHAQALIEVIRPYDDYNWGYDPYHYTVPEGSYSQNSEGVNRILSFRRMVQTLHNLGLRVVMDVVYNHTHAAGLSKQSVLDKIVPGYYHRLHPYTGAIERSTCCDNTATERVMMGKLMIDSLKVWSKDYAIDGFRFDLMGHQPKQLMLAAREAVEEIDDDTYFYGEGWNFGEVANDARFTQATQSNMASSEIGTFSDRLRDAVRGPNFNVSGKEIRRSQGIGNGLLLFANESTPNNANDRHNNHWQLLLLGLAGNLADYQWRQGDLSYRGAEVLYGGNSAGYADDPADIIHYVSKHDNQTLWDNHQYRLPFNASKQQRLSLHAQSLSFPLIAQGIPFIHMGSELARSKSFLRDSYDYGHWFNAVDFSYQNNNYQQGLPAAVKDKDNWSVIQQVREHTQNATELNEKAIKWSRDRFLEWVKIRRSSPLFRLTSRQHIQTAIAFSSHPHQTGAVTLVLNDNALKIDPNYQSIKVLINTSANQVAFDKLDGWSLHPIQQDSNDPVIHSIDGSNGVWSVPAFTNLVLVKDDDR